MKRLKTKNGISIRDHIYMTNTDGSTNTETKFRVTGLRENGNNWLLAKPLSGGKTLEFQTGEFAQVIYF